MYNTHVQTIGHLYSTMYITYVHFHNSPGQIYTFLVRLGIAETFRKIRNVKYKNNLRWYIPHASNA